MERQFQNKQVPQHSVPWRGRLKGHYPPWWMAVLLVVAATPAHAWGPGTHAFLAEQIFGPDQPAAVYGATVADFGDALRKRPEERRALKRLAHFHFGLLPPSSLAAGFTTHNGDWGGDYYAHLYYRPEETTIFSTRCITQLSEELDLPKQRAEDLVEMAVDLHIALDEGPAFGMRLRAAAEGLEAGAAEDVLVVTYAGPLSERVASLSRAEAEERIRWANRLHRTLMRAYGQQLATDEGYIARWAPRILARYLEVDVKTARHYYERAMAVTADYRAEIDRMAVAIHGELLGVPGLAGYPVGVAPAVYVTAR